MNSEPRREGNAMTVFVVHSHVPSSFEVAG
jgi:hypothetical protein